MESHGSQLGEREHGEDDVSCEIHETHHCSPIRVGVGWTSVLGEALEGAKHAGAKQRSESPVEKLLELPPLAIPVDRTGKECTGKGGHHRIAGPGREIRDCSIETHLYLPHAAMA
jgi:hypothetical protein